MRAVFQAFDGKIFTNEGACEIYEKSIQNVVNSIKTIKDYCQTFNNSCEGCPYDDPAHGTCRVGSPCDWEVTDEGSPFIYGEDD